LVSFETNLGWFRLGVETDRAGTNSYYMLRRRRSGATKLGSFSPKCVVPNYLSPLHSTSFTNGECGA
jgi:hypothetical protein